MNDIGVLKGYSVLTENGVIKEIIRSEDAGNIPADKITDLTGKLLLPGLIDCHTHLVFAGSRANEFAMRIKGNSYEKIAEAGGGIISTVKALRNTSPEELILLARPKIDNLIKQGVTTLEIKSGYGLDFDNEIKMLHVIKILNEEYPIDIIPTFLGAHTIPPEFKSDRSGYIKLITDKMLPYIVKNELARFCDAFCESTAFSARETKVILEAASEINLDTKLHTDQFNQIGGIDVALSVGSASVDHLEVMSNSDISKFSEVSTVCTLLPGVSFFLDYSYAPARKLIENNAIVSIATDFNPGSSHICSLHLIMSLAAIKLKMTPEEIISAVTINAAKALLVSNLTGSIETGKKADFSVFDTGDYTEIVYNIGQNLCVMTVKDGEIIYEN